MAVVSAKRHERRSKTGSPEHSGAVAEPSVPARRPGSLGGAFAAGPAMRLPVQTKLTVGQAGDRYEKEADHVADRVTSGKPAGDISRIPAGGLSAQRAEAAGEPPVQRRAEEEPAAQRASSAGDENAQAKCAGCEAEGAAQRQEDDAGGGQGPAADEDRESEDREAAGERGAEETKGPECKPAGEDKEEAKPKEGGEKKAGPDLSCGTSEAEEEEAPPAAGAGSKTCAKGKALGGEAVEAAAGAVGLPAGEASAGEKPSDQVPGCGESVEAEHEMPEAAKPAAEQPAQGPQPGAPPAGPQGPCAPAQRKEEDGEEGPAQRQDEESAQSTSGESEGAQRKGGEDEAQTACASCAGEAAQRAPEDGEAGAQSKAGEEGPEQLAEEEGQSKEKDEGGAQRAEDEAQSKGEDEGAAQRAEDEAESKREDEGAAQRAEDEGQSKGKDQGAAQRAEDEAQSNEKDEGAAQRAEDEGQSKEKDEGAAQRAEDEAQSKETDECTAQREEEEARSRPAAPARRRLQTDVASRHIHARGSGDALLPSVRDRLEANLGVDLEGVRVHTDSNAQAASRALRAKAFTHRNHIFLGPGQSPQDVALLAHESTHVLQQDAVVRRKPAREPDRGVPRAEASPAPAASTPEVGPVAGAKSAAALQAPAVAVSAPPVASGAIATPVAEKATAVTMPPGAAAAPGATPTAVATSAPTPTPAPTATATAIATTTPTTTATPASTATPNATPTLAPNVATAPPAPAAPAPSAAPAAVPARAAAPGNAPVSPAPLRVPGAPAPPIPEAAAPSTPDAGLQRVLVRLDAVARGQKAHPPAKVKVDAAQAAAKAPPNEGASRAEAKRAALMDTKEPGKTQPEDLFTTLCRALNAVTPGTLEEMDDFKKSGRAGEIKGTLQAGVSEQKTAAAAGIDGAARAPDPAPEENEGDTPLPPEAAEGGAPGIAAREAVPAPKPDAEVSAEESKKKTEQIMAENDLDEEQLREANEPQFDDALASKKELEANADALPGRYRKAEAEVLGATGVAVDSSEDGARREMHLSRTGSRARVRSKQEEARRHAEEERQKVADDVELMYRTTKDMVTLRLDVLDASVATTFDAEERSARAQFEAHVTARMAAYKADRYGGWGGGALWLKDKIFSLPDEVNDFYVEGRKIYIRVMMAAIRRIVDLVDRELKAAKKAIADGHERIDRYVRGLKPSLAGAGRKAAAAVASRFEELESSVDDKKQALADDLTRKVKDARAKLDARIKELQEENEGIATKVARKLREIGKIIRAFKERVSALLHESGDVIGQIVKHPIRFLKNLLRAVKGAFHQFKERIGLHLKRGITEWLFGTLGDAGVEVPSSFGAKELFGVVLQILGVTPAKLREKLARLVGPRNVERLEAAWDFVKTLIAEGPGGLWRMLQQKFADLKDFILDAVKDWVVKEIVKQAVFFLVSLFNPVSALLKAIKLIYDVVMFFVENIERILSIVEAIIHSLGRIVAGNVQQAADFIEKALGRAVAVVISFLARIFGLSGVADRVRSVIKSIQDRVNQAIDWLLAKVVKGIRFVGGRLKAGVKKGVAAVKRFLFPSKTFQAGKETHRLFFQGEGAQAPLLVSSDTKRLRAFVKELAGRRDKKPGADAKLALASAQLDRIDAARKILKTNPAKAAADIDAALAAIAKLLAPLLAEGDAGTVANPYGVAWPKRPLAQYDRIYVGPKVGVDGIRIGQDELAAARTRADAKEQIKARLVTRRGPSKAYVAWQARGFAIDVYDPQGKSALPEGGETVGGDPTWQTRDGMKFELHPGGKTGGGGKINRALKPYGYSAGDEGRDGDHVLERQVGGADVLENLWPLESSENRGAGSTLASAQLRVPGERTTVPMETVKQKARNKSVWIVIDRTGKARRRM